ncbi:MAG: hypothetical protein K2I23_03880 [Clostridia bacterium]|nr:hypothetical protein [Clostridia bacterium]
MNKKKIVVSILVIVMALSLALTALVGCKKDNNGYVELNASLQDVLSSAVKNTAEDRYINNLKASAQLDVSAKYGESESKYTIRFGANLALDQTDGKTSELGLSIVDSKANANILNAYYSESRTGGNVYLDLGNGDKAKNFVINGLKVKDVLKSEKKGVSNDEASAINDKVVDGIDDFLGIIKIVSDLCELKQATDGHEIVLVIDLQKVLDKAAPLLPVLDDYTEQLGLDVTSENLASILPTLKIELIFKMQNGQKDNYKNATVAGLEVKLDANKKDMVIKRSDDSTFLRLNIAKDFTADVALNFVFGDNASDAPLPLAANTAYKKINAINFTTEGELTLNSPIGVTVNFNNKDIPILIPAGTYTIKLGADLDPTKLIGTKFNASKTSEILNLVSDIASKVISTIYIKIDSKTDTNLKLDVSIRNGKVNLTDLSLIGELGTAIAAIIPDGLSIPDVISKIKPLLPADKEPSSGDQSGETSGNTSGNTSGDADKSGDNNNDDETMDAIAALIKNMTVLVNGGINVEVKNHTVAKNIWGVTETATKFDDKEGKDVEYEKEVIDEATGKQKEKDLGDTTIDVTAEANKNGITIDAAIKNIVFSHGRAGKAAAGDNAGRMSIAAKVEVKDGVISVTAKTAEKLADTAQEIDFGSGIKMTIDLVLKLTKFEIGNCQ